MIDRSLITVALGRIITIVSMLVWTRVVTEQLSPNEFGKLSVITAFIGFVALFFINPIGMYFNRHFFRWADEQKLWLHMLRSSFYFFGIGLICWGGAWVAFVFAPEVTVNAPVIIPLLIGTYVFLNSTHQMTVPALNLVNARIWWVVVSLLTIWLGLLFSYLLTSHSPTLANWLIGQIGGILIGTVFSIMVLRIRVPLNPVLRGIFQFRFTDIKTIYYFAWPLSITVGMNWIQFQSYRLRAIPWNDYSNMGIIVIAYGLAAGVLTAAESLAMNYYYPILYKKITNAKKKQQALAWEEYQYYLWSMTAIAAAFLIAGVRPLCRILIAPAYWNAGDVVAIFALSELARIWANSIGLIGHITMNTRALLYPQAFGAIGTILLMEVFRFYQFENKEIIGNAILLGSVLFCVLMWYTMRRELPVTIQFSSISKVMMTVLSLMVVSFGAPVIFPPNLGMLGDWLCVILLVLVAALGTFFVVSRNPLQRL